MSRRVIGSFEETRRMSLKNFSRLSAAQKLRWLSDMIRFVDEANPAVRRRRLGVAAFNRSKR